MSKLKKLKDAGLIGSLNDSGVNSENYKDVINFDKCESNYSIKGMVFCPKCVPKNLYDDVPTNFL